MAEQEKTTGEVEEVKEETSASATEEVVEKTEEAAETVTEEKTEEVKEETPKKKEKKEKKAKKGGKKGLVIALIAVAAVLVLAVGGTFVFSMIMQNSAINSYNSAVQSKNAEEYEAAYDATKLAFFMSQDQKDQIAEAYILNCLVPQGQYLAASEILEETGFTPEKKAEIYAKDETFALCKVGQVVKFGEFNTDNNVGNGNEKLEWIVLDVIEKDGKASALLLSRNIVGNPGGWNRFADSEDNAVYSQSNLHSYCEQEFFNELTRSDIELKQKILPTEVVTKDSKGNDDKVTAHVYAPSKEELDKYLTGDLAQYLIAEPLKTAKSIQKGRYYLRSLGAVESGSQYAAGYDRKGEYQQALSMTEMSGAGARVCIQVDLGAI